MKKTTKTKKKKPSTKKALSKKTKPTLADEVRQKVEKVTLITMETETTDQQQLRTENASLTLIPPTEASTVKEGTAKIEPQFIVLRHGVKFVTAMTFKELHKALLQAEELEEQIVEIDFSMEGYPLDCIVQVNRAIWEVYGFSHAKERMTFFGPIPPKRLNIKISRTESVQVVYGEMAPPAWEGGSIDMGVDMKNPLSLAITGQVKRKFEPAIKDIVHLAEKLLREQSIYRGNAVELDLNYIVTGEFNPAHCAPKFINVESPVNLILPKDIEFEIETNIWNIMRNPAHFRNSGIPIKSGVLLDGIPGTGKTLTAYQTARNAIQNGWTYIYLRTPLNSKTFLTGYRLAQLYGPSIFFVEDCDVLFGKKRDEEMNQLLETLDGITAKTAEVITIFTTNYPERLDQAFTRSGRINHQITFRAPDAEAAGRFVQSMASEYLAHDIDLEEVGKAFQNLVPADIQNGIDQAKKHCIGVTAQQFKEEGRTGYDGDITHRMTTEMLVVAAEVVRRKASRNIGEVNPHEEENKVIKAGVQAMFGEVAKGMEVVKQTTTDTAVVTKKIAKKFGV